MTTNTFRAVAFWAGTQLSDFATGLNGPAGLALDGAGNLFEVDRNSRIINEFDSAGNLIDSFETPSILPSFVAVEAPEPSTMAMLGLAGVGALGYRFRRKK